MTKKGLINWLNFIPDGYHIFMEVRIHAPKQGMEDHWEVRPLKAADMFAMDTKGKDPEAVILISTRKD